MDPLSFHLKNLCVEHKEGSFKTQAQRHYGLQMIARELGQMGYRLPAATSLKEKHVHALVDHWQANGISTGAVKNRMSWLRWAARKIRRGSIVPRSNDKLDIGQRDSARAARAHITTTAKMGALPDWIQMALRLQMAFGLRLEESLKLRSGIADLGTHLALKGSWCKGGRARHVPVHHARQRALLDELRAYPGGCVIPQGMNYLTARKAIEKATWGAGIRNMHGHRHWYAQWRYQTLTGWKAPAAGGPTVDNMSKADQAADYRARLTISRELGHNRIAITNVYLGRRQPARAA